MYKLLISILSIALITGASIGVYWYMNRGGEGLDINITSEEKISLGVPFIVKVGVSNNSGSVLSDAKVALSVGDGLAFLGSSPTKNVETKSFGTIGEGSVIQEEFELIALKGENTILPISAVVSYLPKGVSSRFDKKQDGELAIGLSGISLDLKVPERALSGEDFAIEISYKNISGIDFKNLTLKANYPPGFEYKKSSLPPDLGNNTWRLGDLRKGSEMKFTVNGNLVGAENSKPEIKTALEAEFLGESYTVSEKSAAVEISASPLSLQIVPNNDPGFIAGAGEELRYSIIYMNSTDQGFRDAILKVQLSGEMFDFSSIKSNGIISPLGNSVIWNPSTNSDFAVIPPRSNNKVDFTIKTKPSYPIRRLSDKNFVLKADSRIESPTVLPSVQSKNTVGVAKLETKVRGEVNIETSAFFRDATSGILNKGSIPPRIDSLTNYTIHWVIKNYSSDVSNVLVRANLAPGVKFTGVSKSNASTNINYSDGTQEVSWELPRILATKGVVDSPYEVIFQIEATPGANHLRSYMPLVSETSITAKDDFTGQDLVDKDDAITTALPDDATIGSQGGIVIQ